MLTNRTVIAVLFFVVAMGLLASMGFAQVVGSTTSNFPDRIERPHPNRTGQFATWGASASGTFHVLHAFSGGRDGGNPYAGLSIDRAGNLYGTTWAGGDGLGTVFQLKHSGSIWISVPLYAFKGNAANDGAGPTARVIFGPDALSMAPPAKVEVPVAGLKAATTAAVRFLDCRRRPRLANLHSVRGRKRFSIDSREEATAVIPDSVILLLTKRAICMAPPTVEERMTAA